MRKQLTVPCAQCGQKLRLDVWHIEQTYWEPEEFDYEILEQECDCSVDDWPVEVENAFTVRVMDAFNEARYPMRVEDDFDMADWWEKEQKADNVPHATLRV